MSLYDVLGQEHIAELISGSLKDERVGHAYIFAGPKGVGKAKMALEFAKALNCNDKQNDSCDQCQTCKRIEHHNHHNVIWLKPDGNSIKIDQIRQLQKDFHYRPVGIKYKVIIIEQAEQMTHQAANSLLKFLEEPGFLMVAILLIENPNQLLVTIRSRCQIINFATLSTRSITEILKNEGFKESDILLASHITADIEAIRGLLKSEEFAQMRSLMIQWSEDIHSKKYQVLLSINDKIMKNDYIKGQLPLFLDLLIMWYRDILNIKLGRRNHIIYSEYEDILNRQALYLTDKVLINHIEVILRTKKQITSYVNLQLALENMVLSLWEG